MKFVKKPLSVLLALVMAFSTWSACLSVVSAASSYSASTVKSLVDTAASKAVGTASASNAYNYTGDDGSVLAAAEAVYDYAVNAARGGTSTTSSYNSTDTLLARVASLIGTGTSGNSYNTLQRLINPNGTTVYGYESRQSKSGSYTKDKYGWKPSPDGFDTSELSYNGSVTNSVTKTISVAINVSDYLCTFSSISAIPASFNTKVTYKYGMTNSTTYSSSRTTNTSNVVYVKWTWYWTSYKWNYINSVNRTVNSTDTTSQPALVDANNYFTADKLDDTVQELINNNTAEALETLYATATANYNTLKGKVSATVISHFFGNKIETYLGNVEKAKKLAVAKRSMAAMLGYINDGFTPVTEENYKSYDIDALVSLATKVNKAYNDIKDIEDSIIDEVKDLYPELDAFTKADSLTFVNDVNYNIDLYNAYRLKDTIDNEYATWSDKVADPNNSDDITNLELAALKDRFNGYATTLNNFVSAAREEVFTTEYLNDFNAFRAAIQLKIDTRNAEVVYDGYYEYFLPFIFANISKWSNDEITNRYTLDTAKQSQLISAYNGHVSQLGKDITDIVYTMEYNGEDTLLTVAVADYIARLKTNITERADGYLDKIEEYAGLATSINFNNFIGVKSAIDQTDLALVKYANDKGFLDAEHKTVYNNIQPLLNNYNAFVASGGLNTFKQNHYHDNNNIYTTRKAGDVEGGYPNDIARTEGQDYDVTVDRINSTISKLDKFLTSEDFCSLVGLKDPETGNAYKTLSIAIDELLKNNLFTDEMINTVVEALFPTLCNTLNGMLTDLGSLGANGITSTSGAAALINLGTLTGGTLNGYIKVYDDNRRGTPTLQSVFEGFGIYIYPSSLAKKLTKSAYSSIRSALNSAGTNWDKVPRNAEGKFAFEWGLNNVASDQKYNAFVTIVGDIFTSLLPLLQTLLVGATFDKTTSDKFAYAENSGNVTFKYDTGIPLVNTVSVTASEMQAYGKVNLRIPGLYVYKDVWIPVMEAFGITDYNTNYKFTTLSSSASATQIAGALFDPLMELIKQIKEHPIDKITSMLPQLVYGLSMDGLQSLINKISLTLNVNISLTSVEKLTLSGASILSSLTTTIGGWLLGVINDNIPSISQPLALKDLINIKDLIGCEYTNLNDLLAFLFDMLGFDLKLPIMNAGRVIQCSSYVTNAPSARSSGKRLKLTADKADVFYVLLEYIVSAVGDRAFVEDLVSFIKNFSSNESASEEELPEIVYTIIEKVGSNKDDALAALVELFNPTTYTVKEPDWVTAAYTYSTDIEDFDETSLVYLRYQNDWTRAKADDIIENADKIMESVMAMIGTDETSFNASIQKSIAKIFNNKAFTGLVEALVSLGYIINNDFAYDLIARELKVDIRTWAKTFGDLFPETVEKALDGKDAPDFTNVPVISGVSATTDENGELVWTVNGTEFVDGERNTFFDLFTTVCAPFADIISVMLTGTDIELFEKAIKIKGYPNYAKSIGILFEAIGVENVLTQAEYAAMAPADAFNYLTKQLFDRIDDILTGNTIKKFIQILPTLTYFVQSNGLSTSIYNLLLPILVLVDEVRPIIDIDINNLLSVLVSDVLNSLTDSIGTGEDIAINIDADKILGILINGEVEEDNDTNHKSYDIDINDLTLTTVIRIADKILGTNFEASELVTLGFNGLCIGAEKNTDSVNGVSYKSSIIPADTLTILLTAILESLQYKVSNTSDVTNGEQLCAFIEKALGEESELDITTVYNTVIELIKGLDVEYTTPNWKKMFGGNLENGADGSLILPEGTINYIDNYLKYNTDWTKGTAEEITKLLEDILAFALKDSDIKSLSGLIKGILNNNLYTEANLETVVELVVNFIAGVDENLRDLIDTVICTDIATWFKMCEKTTDEETGEEKYVCTKNWGIDELAENAKEAAFIDAICEVLAPASSLLSTLFFGTDYKFFTSSKKDTNGNYTYEAVIKVNGVRGYDFVIVPILEALGCEPKQASEYLEDGKYNVMKAVKEVLTTLVEQIDTVTGTTSGILAAIPNLLYFINSDGLVSVVKTLLAPFEAAYEALSPVLNKDGQPAESIASLISEYAGFDITALTTDTILDLISEKTGIALSGNIYTIISNLYIGKISQYTSANGETAYKMGYTDEQSAADMVTIIISLILELYTTADNRTMFADILGNDACTIIDLLLGEEHVDFDYGTPNWNYMSGTLTDNGIALPPRTGDAYANYTKYTNNWNDKSADYLNDNLKEFINAIVKAAKESDSTIGVMLDAAITDGLYKDEVLNKLVEAVVTALGDIDYVIVKSVGVVLGGDVDEWFDYCTIERDADGKVTNVTCTRNWGIDEKTTNAEKKTAFIEAFKAALKPAYRLLAWLCLGQDYTFFNDAAANKIITISGGKGYDYGIVPILEALGCENVQNSSAYLLDGGNYDVSAAVGYVLEAICDKLTEMCGDDTLGVMLEMLPNVVYFINAGGLTVSVDNLLKPVYHLIDTLSPVIGEVNVDELLGFPISNLDFEAIFKILADTVKLNFKDSSRAFAGSFYMGQITKSTSANNNDSYYMTYSDTETRRDMITVLLSLLLENISYDKNEEVLTKWFGREVYESLLNLLALTEAKGLQDFDWKFTEYADTDKTFNPIETSGRYKDPYNKVWTREYAQYIADNLDSFVDNTLCLLGLQIDGIDIEDIGSFIEFAIDDNLYTQENANTIIEAIKGATSELTANTPYGEYVAGILQTSLGFDLNAWDNMTVTSERGDAEEFAEALAEIIAPAAPLFRVLLVGEDVKFFYDIEGKDQITIPGSEGYAYGIIPLLEALGCENIKTPDEFKALLKTDEKAAVRAIVDPLFARITDIESDPVNKVMEMLPAVIYFINSNGLDTSVKNMVNSIDTVLAALEPIVGKTDLCTLLGIGDLSTYDFNNIVSALLNFVKDETGYDFTAIALNAVSEFTMGKVVSYTSKNGEQYYTMEYAGTADETDMVTVVLRVLLDFVTMKENKDKVKSFLGEYIKDETNYKAVCKFIDYLAEAARQDESMSGAMHVIYRAFCALKTGVDNTHEVYHNVNKKWETIAKSLKEDETSIPGAIFKDFEDIFGEYFEGIITDDGIAPDGAIPFFSAIVRFFKNLINFFKNLFK